MEKIKYVEHYCIPVTWGNYEFEDYYKGEMRGEKCHGKGAMYYHYFEELKTLERVGVENYKDAPKNYYEKYTQTYGKDSPKMGIYLYKIYVGEWKNDKRHGKGKLTYPHYKKPLEPYEKTIKYVGEWKDDKYHGQGTEKFFIDCYVNKEGEHGYNEAEYVGAWKNGEKDGKGTLTSKNTWSPEVGDEKYIGQWKNDKRNGHGTQVFGANKYVGEWKDDKCHGQGTKHQADGCIYAGQWKNGKIHGKVKIIRPDGSKYVGNAKDGLPHGQGAAIYPDKSKQEGMWHKGEFVEVDESKKN